MKQFLGNTNQNIFLLKVYAVNLKDRNVVLAMRHFLLNNIVNKANELVATSRKINICPLPQESNEI